MKYVEFSYGHQRESQFHTTKHVVSMQCLHTATSLLKKIQVCTLEMFCFKCEYGGGTATGTHQENYLNN